MPRQPPPKFRPTQWRVNALKRLRLNTTLDGLKHATQFEIGRAIGIGTNRYHTLETGQGAATPREARALAKLFKVTERALDIDIKHSNHVIVRPPAKTRRTA